MAKKTSDPFDLGSDLEYYSHCSLFGEDSMMLGGGGTSTFLVDQGLLLNASNSEYMHRTPSVAGNRKTWTYSVWFKRGNITSVMNLFNAGASEDLAINASDQLIFNMGTASYISTQVFRDTGAWQSLVVVVDTTQATAANRVRFYHNGTEITAFGTETDPAQNEDFAVNSTTLHTIAANEGGTEEWDGYLSEINFIDGAALDASYFGETDSNGYWMPIEYAGTDIVYNWTSSEGNTSNPAITVTTDLTLNVGTVDNLVDGDFSAVGFSGTVAFAAQTAAGKYIKFDFGSGNDKVVTAVQWDQSITQPTFVVKWQGSNNDSDWTDIGSNVTMNSATTTIADLSANTTSYRYYRQLGVSGSWAAAVDNEECMFKFENGTGYGTNGGHYDFADADALGIDVSTENTAATVTHTYGLLHKLNGTSHTFSGVSTGTAHATRQIAVGVAGWGATGNAFTVSSVTVGGISATVVPNSKVQVGSLSESGTEFWVARVPTGTTADVVVTYGYTMDGMGIELFNITNGGAAYDVNAVSGDAINAPVDCTAGGVICGISWSDGGGTPSYTWTGLTEDHDAQQDAAPTGHAITGASDAFATKQSALAIDADNAVAPTYMATSVVAFTAGGDNSFLSVNLTSASQVSDVPTNDAANDKGNFNVMDPNNTSSSFTLSNANTNVTVASDKGGLGTIAVTAGKWKFHAKVTTTATSIFLGWAIPSLPVANRDQHQASNSNDSTWCLDGLGRKWNQGANSTIGSTWSNDDIITCLVDVDAGKVWWAVNDTVLEGDPDAGTGASYTSTAITNNGVLAFVNSAGVAGVIQLNFGQLSAPTYSSHSAFKDIATHNMDAPTIIDPSAYFQPHAYTGTGAAHDETFGGNSSMDPDLVWIKNRDQTDGHKLFDTVRGATKYVNTDALASEVTDANSVDDLGVTNGFGLDTGAGGFNDNTEKFISWNWVKGATPGFDIQSETGVASSGTITHDLGVTPDLILCFDQGASNDKVVWHSGVHATSGNGDRLKISDNTANSTSPFSIAACDAADFTVGSHATWGDIGDWLFYLWAGVEGFSKFGTYEGNNVNDGTFVYLGFRPAFILIKNIDGSGNWGIWDVARNTYNPLDAYLLADVTNTEDTPANIKIDAVSNGFKLRGTWTGMNAAQTYVYAAFAEHPLTDGAAAQARAG